MVDAKDVNKFGEQQNQGAQAGAQQPQASQPQAQAQPAAATGHVGQPQDLQLGALVEEVRTYLQKTVDALNSVSTVMQSANDTQRGLTETMSKIAGDLADVKKTIGDVIAENKKQDQARQTPPRDAAIDPEAGETAEHKEVMPSDAELKDKVPGKKLLGQSEGESTEKSAKKEIVKTGGATPSPTSQSKIEEIDISKALVKDILEGKLKGVGNVINRVNGGKN